VVRDRIASNKILLLKGSLPQKECYSTAELEAAGGAHEVHVLRMMSRRSKRELLEEIRPRYLKAKRHEKKVMLDEFVATTGYHRKYAIRILKHGRPRSRGKRYGLAKVYQGEVVVALEQIWEVCGRICSKRLHPFLPEMVKVLERWGELQLTPETKALLLRMSRSTMDRCLAPARFKHPHGRTTTRPGSLLKKAIPVRTYTPWDEEHPGFLEVDLVAHCGETTEGQYEVHVLVS